MKYYLHIKEDVLEAVTHIGQNLPKEIEISCDGVSEVDFQILLETIYNLPYEMDFDLCDELSDAFHNKRRFNFHFKRLSMESYKEKFMNILDILAA